jgi:hypothetical protein
MIPIPSSTPVEDAVQDLELLVSRLESETRPDRSRRAATSSQVILTHRQALTRKYGPRGFAAIDQALRELAERTERSQGMETRLLYADEADSVKPYGTWPSDPSDAASVKRLIEAIHTHATDRDQKAPSILLVGGDDILPFYRWPRTEEGHVLTDALYAAAGDQLFRPARPVGRIPDAANPDLGYFLHVIASAAEGHEMARAANTFGNRLRQALTGSARGGQAIPAYGYTASLWKEATREVFRAIGDPDALRISPPLSRADFAQARTGPALMFFGLSGLRRRPGWYGQCDPTFAADSTPFPLVVSPEDIIPWQSPSAIVFSQAGFAGDLTAKTPRASMTLRLLATQAIAVISSTAMAHGSLTPPLVGADLLARYFWEALGEGARTGEALRTAKVRFARDMMAYQGYLDLDDQKTLLAFTLFGDPAILPAGPVSARERTVHDLLQGDALPAIRCQLRAVQQPLATTPLDLQRRVLDYASERLPHLADARLTVSRPILCDGDCAARCRLTETMYRAAHPGVLSVNYVFTFTGLHRLEEGETEINMARITVSPRGTLLKVTLSR